MQIVLFGSLRSFLCRWRHVLLHFKLKVVSVYNEYVLRGRRRERTRVDLFIVWKLVCFAQLLKSFEVLSAKSIVVYLKGSRGQFKVRKLSFRGKLSSDSVVIVKLSGLVPPTALINYAWILLYFRTRFKFHNLLYTNCSRNYHNCFIKHHNVLRL